MAHGVNIARAALTEGALRSGVLGSVPVAGAALRLIGGKKKTVAAGLRLISPQTGQTLAAASGEARRTRISWGGIDSSGSRNGRMFSAAFVIAYNGLLVETAALSAPAAD